MRGGAFQKNSLQESSTHSKLKLITQLRKEAYRIVKQTPFELSEDDVSDRRQNNWHYIQLFFHLFDMTTELVTPQQNV